MVARMKISVAHKSGRRGVRVAAVGSGIVAAGAAVKRERKPRARSVVASAAAGSKFDGGWAKLNPAVTGAAFLGWTLPASIPVSGFDGNSLTGKFIGSMFDELSHFPKGPAMTDEFWLLMVTWHAGLFLALLLGQIGWQGKKAGYFK